MNVFQCSSDPIAGEVHDSINEFYSYNASPLIIPGRASWTSYAGMFGSFDVNVLPRLTDCKVDPAAAAQANGIFIDHLVVRAEAITDGMSNTIAVVERAQYAIQALAEFKPEVGKKYGWWYSGNLCDSLVTSFYPIQAQKRVGRVAAEIIVRSASSPHQNLTYALFADASVRPIRDQVATWAYDSLTGIPVNATNSNGVWINTPKPEIWQSLSTRSGGEAIGEY